MKTIRLTTIVLSFLLVTISGFSQKTRYYTDIQEKIRSAKELISREKYNAAYRLFEKIQSESGPQSELYSEAEYYKSFALLKSGNDKKIEAFIKNYPESPYLNQARFNLGSYQFDRNRHKMAIRTLNQVEQNQLNEKELVYLHYQLGYSYMQDGDLEKAATEFYEIKDANNIYSKPACYYWAHINYLGENYESALNGLRKLNGDPNYSQVIPLYVSHIYYKQKKYNEIVDYTTGIIDDIDKKHQPELAKIIGDSYFHLNDFDSAIPYLERYHQSTGLKSAEDNYLLGYCYYVTGGYAKAIPFLEKASKAKNEMAQNAYYHLADCYVKTDKKEKARFAFEAASEMDFNEVIKEDALFNYAKITYELSYSPFSETIKAFDKYISSYPNSGRNNSAYQYLVEVYMVTRNYEDAINSIEKIKVKNQAINRAYQRVTFFRGLELFNDQNYNAAITSFDKSLQNTAGGRETYARAMYWKAEALYRLGDLNSAISQYNSFLVTPGAFSIDEYHNAQYNLAYAYFELEDYQQANSFFRKYLNANQGKRNEKIADALNRLGDCYFLSRDYGQAKVYYGRSYNMKLFAPDYALFQTAFCDGLQRNYQDKVTNLRNLLRDYPRSDYRDDALYELGKAYELVGQNSEAINLYNDIVKNYKQSSYYKKAVLQLGLVNYNNGNLKKALNYYKEVAEGYPNTDEAAAALTGIKNAYVESNNVDAYFAYTQKLGRGEVSTSEQDALSYQAAEKLFMDGGNAIPQLQKYINNFPYGTYLLNAHFYLGEALYAKGDFSEALGHYEYVANQSDNLFSEPAVSKAAELIYNAGRHSQALELFNRLEVISGSPYNNLKAYAGQMNCHFKLEHYNEASSAAQKVKSAEKANPQLIRDANYILAKSYYKLNNLNQALSAFQQLAVETNSAEGAEAKYIVAELHFKNNQLKKSEDEIMDFISQGTPHQYWLGKSFILLASIYQAQNDGFQAKHTLRSVVENYGNNTDGIIAEASGKLAQIEAKEQAEQEKAKSNPVEININQQNNQ